MRLMGGYLFKLREVSRLLKDGSQPRKIAFRHYVSLPTEEACLGLSCKCIMIGSGDWAPVGFSFRPVG